MEKDKNIVEQLKVSKASAHDVETQETVFATEFQSPPPLSFLSDIEHVKQKKQTEKKEAKSDESTEEKKVEQISKPSQASMEANNSIEGDARNPVTQKQSKTKEKKEKEEELKESESNKLLFAQANPEPPSDGAGGNDGNGSADSGEDGDENPAQKKEGKPQTSESSTSDSTIPEEVRGKMESTIGHDFSNVNIHTNSSQASDVGALAYTQGTDIHFAPGQYDPSSSSGQELIGHELTHVKQQADGRVKPTTQASNGMAVNDDKGLEAEADTLGNKAANAPNNSVIKSTQLKTSTNQSKVSQNKSTVIQRTEDEDWEWWEYIIGESQEHYEQRRRRELREGRERGRREFAERQRHPEQWRVAFTENNHIIEYDRDHERRNELHYVSNRNHYRVGDIILTSSFTDTWLRRIFPQIEDLIGNDDINFWDVLGTYFDSNYGERKIGYRITNIQTSNPETGEGQVNLQAVLFIRDNEVVEINGATRSHNRNQLSGVFQHVLMADAMEQGIEVVGTIVQFSMSLATGSLGLSAIGQALGRIGLRALPAILRPIITRLFSFLAGRIASAIGTIVRTIVTDLHRQEEDNEIRRRSGGRAREIDYAGPVVRALVSAVTGEISHRLDGFINERISSGLSQQLPDTIGQSLSTRIKIFFAQQVASIAGRNLNLGVVVANAWARSRQGEDLHTAMGAELRSVLVPFFENPGSSISSIAGSFVTSMTESLGGPSSEQAAQGKFENSEHPKTETKASDAGNNIIQKMESSFGTSFSDVNIHENSQSAKENNALAYTQGSDIHFAPGQFKPGTKEGQELIGHELTHVVQQREGRVKPTTQLKSGMQVNDDPGLEREADVMGAKVASGITPSIQKKEDASVSTIQKQDADNLNRTSGSINAHDNGCGCSDCISVMQKKNVSGNSLSNIAQLKDSDSEDKPKDDGKVVSVDVKITDKDATQKLSGDYKAIYKHFDGNMHAAHVEPKLPKEINPVASGKKDWKFTIPITLSKKMPVWTNLASIKQKAGNKKEKYQKYYQKVVREWEKLYASLEKHENKHKEIDKAGFNGLAAKMKGKSLDDAYAAYDQVLVDLATAHNNFHNSSESAIYKLKYLQKEPEKVGQKKSGQENNSGAQALKQENDINFAPGQLKPNTKSGQESLSHELTDGDEQRGGRVKPTSQLKSEMQVNDDPGLEKEADEIGARIANGESINLASKSNIQVNDLESIQFKKEGSSEYLDYGILNRVDFEINKLVYGEQITNADPKEILEYIYKNKYRYDVLDYLQYIPDLTKLSKNDRFQLIQFIKNKGFYSRSNVRAYFNIVLSFGSEAKTIIKSDFELFKKFREYSFIYKLSRLEFPFEKEVKKSFKRDVRRLAESHLIANYKRLGTFRKQLDLQGLGVKKGDYVKELMGQDEESKALVKNLKKASGLLSSMETMKKNMDNVVVSFHNSGMWMNPIFFNPGKKPKKDISAEEKEIAENTPYFNHLNFSTWDKVKPYYDMIDQGIYSIISEYPMLYILSQEKKLDKLNTSESRFQDMAYLASAIVSAETNIENAISKISSGDTFFKLKPIHEQILAGMSISGGTATNWTDEFNTLIVKDYISDWEDDQFFKDLLADLGIAAAFIISAAVTGGAATAFFAGLGVLGAGAKIGMKWNEVGELESLADTGVSKETEIVSESQVAIARMEAWIETIFSGLDILGGAKTIAKVGQKTFSRTALKEGSKEAMDKAPKHGLKSLDQLDDSEKFKILSESVKSEGLEYTSKHSNLTPDQIRSILAEKGDSQVAKLIGDQSHNLGELSKKLKNFKSIPLEERDQIVSQAILQLGPAKTLKTMGIGWKNLNQIFPVGSDTRKLLLEWRDEVLAKELSGMFGGQAKRTGTTGSFSNDFDWNFYGSSANANREKAIGYLTQKLNMSFEEVKLFLDADFFSDPARLVLYDTLPEELAEQISRDLALNEEKIIYNKLLLQAIDEQDEKLIKKLRGIMDDLEIEELSSKELDILKRGKDGIDEKGIENEIEKLHKEIEKTEDVNQKAVLIKRIGELQTQLNLLNPGAYITGGGVKRFAILREMEGGLKGSFDEMMGTQWYGAMMDQLPHLQDAILKFRKAQESGDLLKSIKAISKYGERLTSTMEIAIGEKAAVRELAMTTYELQITLARLSPGNKYSLRSMSTFIEKDVEIVKKRIEFLISKIDDIQTKQLVYVRRGMLGNAKGGFGLQVLNQYSYTTQQFRRLASETKKQLASYTIEELTKKIALSENPLNPPIQKKENKGSDFTGNGSNISMPEGINIHQNSSKASSLNALAYTQGSDIHFAPGQFKPDTREGQELIGHEMAHVQQQKEGRVQPTTQYKGTNINDNPSLEKEADDFGKVYADSLQGTNNFQSPTSQFSLNENGTKQLKSKNDPAPFSLNTNSFKPIQRSTPASDPDTSQDKGSKADAIKDASSQDGNAPKTEINLSEYAANIAIANKSIEHDLLKKSMGNILFKGNLKFALNEIEERHLRVLFKDYWANLESIVVQSNEAIDLTGEEAKQLLHSQESKIERDTYILKNAIWLETKLIEQLKISCQNYQILELLAKAYKPGFNATFITKELYASMYGGLTGWGTDEDRIFKALTGLSALEVDTVKKAYKFYYDRTLVNDLNSEMSGGADKHRWQALLSGDKAQDAAAALNNAMKSGWSGIGLGTDEAAIMSTLRNKTPEEIAAIKKAYKKLYNVELTTHMGSELGGHDDERAKALLASNTNKADAIGLDQAMHGTFLGIDFGTDEQGLENIYKEIRKDIESDPNSANLSTQQIDKLVKERNKKVEGEYNKKYKVEGDNASSLRNAFDSEMTKGSGYNNLMNAYADNDLTKIDASKIQVESEGFLYASDFTINQTLENQYKRAHSELMRDVWPIFKAEIDRQGGDKYEKRRLEKLYMAEIHKLALQKAEDYMKGLKTETTKQTGWDFNYLINRNTMMGGNKKATALIENNGYLSPAEQIWYGTAIDGTDEDAVKKALQGKSLDEIKKIDAEFKKLSGGKSLQQALLEDHFLWIHEMSGRDWYDVKLMLKYGEAQNVDEEMEYNRERVKTEKENAGWLEFRTGAQIEAMDRSLEAMESQYGVIKDTKASPEDIERAKSLFESGTENVTHNIQGYREQADAVANAATIIGAVVIGIIIAIASWGTLSKLSILIISSAVASATSMIGKRLLSGASYGSDAIALDLGMAAIDIMTAGLTKGMGDELIDSIAVLSKMAKDKGRLSRLLAQGIAEGYESLPGNAASSFIQEMLNDKNWDQNDPMKSILFQSLVNTAISTGQSVGMSMITNTAKDIKDGMKTKDPNADSGVKKLQTEDVDITDDAGEHKQKGKTEGDQQSETVDPRRRITGGSTPDSSIPQNQGNQNAPRTWDDPDLTFAEFREQYRGKYENTSLTDADLIARYRSGQRLHPITGRLRRIHGPTNYNRETFIWDNIDHLAAGDQAMMRQFLEVNGTWQRTISLLGNYNNARVRDVAENLQIFRNEICNHLDETFNARAVGGASTKPESDVDLNISGENAGRDLIRAEQYMQETYGENWSEMFRMNFYTEASRLTQYTSAQRLMTNEDFAALQTELTALTEKYNYAQMLMHANDDPQQLKLIDSMMAHVPDDVKAQGKTLYDTYSGENGQAMITERRNELLIAIDQDVKALNQARRADNQEEVVRLSNEITRKQMECNLLTEEAYIGPGAGRMIVNGVEVRGHEAYQSAISQYNMIIHDIHMKGGLDKALREYEIYKYLFRLLETIRVSANDNSYNQMTQMVYRIQRQYMQNTDMITGDHLSTYFKEIMEYARVGVINLKTRAKDNPGNWTPPESIPWDDPSMTFGEFSGQYTEQFPNTELSHDQLLDRFMSGDRVNPESGRLKGIGPDRSYRQEPSNNYENVEAFRDTFDPKRKLSSDKTGELYNYYNQQQWQRFFHLGNELGLDWPPAYGGYNTQFNQPIKKGQTYDRYGGALDNLSEEGNLVLTGEFFSPMHEGNAVPFEQRALNLPEEQYDLYYRIEVMKDLDFTAENATVIPYYGLEGGGQQSKWNIPTAEGEKYPMSLTQLAEEGYIKITILDSPSGRYVGYIETTIE